MFLNSSPITGHQRSRQVLEIPDLVQYLSHSKQPVNIQGVCDIS